MPEIEWTDRITRPKPDHTPAGRWRKSGFSPTPNEQCESCRERVGCLLLLRHRTLVTLTGSLAPRSDRIPSAACVTNTPRHYTSMPRVSCRFTGRKKKKTKCCGYTWLPSVLETTRDGVWYNMVVYRLYVPPEFTPRYVDRSI